MIPSHESYDVVIEEGRIVDGTGSPGYYGDLGILGGRIAKIGDLKGARAILRMKAHGLVVAPGFIDIHTHADEAIEKFPIAQNYLRQGVTTIVGGQCGDSIYPIGEKIAALQHSGIGINFSLFVGHSTIRKQVMEMADRSPTGVELRSMKELVAKAMEEGALGLSTGLYYAPGSYSKTEEIVELAKVVCRYGGLYTSHIRDESDYSVGLVAALEEAIKVGEEAKIPVQIAHLKALGMPVWGKADEMLDLVRRARARGVDVTFDQYPYVASETTLRGAVVPVWAQAGGDTRMKERLLDPSLRDKIMAEMLVSMDKRGGPENLFIARFAPEPRLEGKNLVEIGKARGKEPVEVAIGLLLRGGADMVSFSMFHEDVIRIMQSPMGMVASDGSLVEFGRGMPHPRYYGTFPRVLGKYVREQGILTLEEAVRKMTSAPAERLGFFDRGRIKDKMIADLTLFNPNTITDRATFENPHQYPVGIDTVIVNGQVVFTGGEWTGMRAGRVLYRGSSLRGENQ